MVYRHFTKTKIIFLCLYSLYIVAIYYAGYTEFSFASTSFFSLSWFIMNLWVTSSYIIGGCIVIFLGFSNIKRWLVNLASVISCSVLPFNVLYYGQVDSGGTGLEGIIFFIFNTIQLCFIFIFIIVIYFIGFVVRLFGTTGSSQC